MKISVYYARKLMSIEIPDENIGDVLSPNDFQAESFDIIMETGLRNPFNSIELKRFLDSKSEILFIVNDASRPTPTQKILSSIKDELDSIHYKFLVATGAHKAPDESELEFIFGDNLDNFRERIFIHDCYHQKQMEYVGITGRGTEISLNQLFFRADKIVIIGSVEPHYFAGYTGGRKSILPGIASYKTIEQNHSLALSANSKSLSLKGNPIHEDIMEAMTLLNKPIFSIQAVLGKSGQIYSISCGDLVESFTAAIKSAKRIYSVKATLKSDIVIAVAHYPMDKNFYQSQKAIENGKLILKKNGILILVSQCRDGIGPKKFYDLLAAHCKPEEIITHIEKEYVLGYHKSYKMAEIQTHSQIWAVSDLDSLTLEQIRIRQFESLQKAIDNALEIEGTSARISILHDACNTVPNLV